MKIHTGHMREKKALVTGGTGFTGDALVRALIERGWKVAVYDIEASEHPLPGVEYFQGDIRDVVSVKKAASGVSVIFHLAALVPVSKESFEIFHDVNTGGTHAALEGARANKARLVFFSTSSPLYPANATMPVIETTKQQPRYAYGISKAAAEKLCYVARQRDVPVAIIRPRTIIGAGRMGIFEILFDWVKTGVPIGLFGGGDNRLQFVALSDLIDLSLKLAEAPKETFNQDYNVGASEFETLRKDIETLIKRAQSTSEIAYIPPILKLPALALMSLGGTPLSHFHIATIDENFYFDCSKAQALLGWKPKYSNAEALIAGYEWYIKQPKVAVGKSHRYRLKRGLLSLAPFIFRYFPSVKKIAREPVNLSSLPIVQRITVLLATGFGVGLITRCCQGTVASLAALILLLPMATLSPLVHYFTIITLIGGAIFIAGKAEKIFGVRDDSRIVIDEIASILITFAGHTLNPTTLLVGFIANRAFDIVKPPPLRITESLPRGWGIVMDDVLAGAYANLTLIVLEMALYLL